MAVQSTLRKPEDPLQALYAHYATLLRTRVSSASKLTKLLSTITLALTIIGTGYGGSRWFRRRRAEKETGRRLLRRNSGLRGKDGSRTIFVPNRDSTSKVVIHPTKQTTFDAHRRLFLQPPRAARMSDNNNPQAPPPQTKPGLNLAFLHQFLSLLNIMIPRWNSKETGLLLSHGVFLMLRTYLSLVVARLDGEIVRDLVAGNGKLSSGVLSNGLEVLIPQLTMHMLCGSRRRARDCGSPRRKNTRYGRITHILYFGYKELPGPEAV